MLGCRGLSYKFYYESGSLRNQTYLLLGFKEEFQFKWNLIMSRPSRLKDSLLCSCSSNSPPDIHLANMIPMPILVRDLL